jgi:hypothetical protein
MGAHDQIPPDPAISGHIAQGSSSGESSGTQRSSKIKGDRHPTDHHLGSSWNPRTATLFARPTGPHAAGQLHGRLVVDEKQPTANAACAHEAARHATASMTTIRRSNSDLGRQGRAAPRLGHTTHGPRSAGEGAPPPRRLRQMGHRHRRRHRR